MFEKLKESEAKYQEYQKIHLVRKKEMEDATKSLWEAQVVM